MYKGRLFSRRYNSLYIAVWVRSGVGPSCVAITNVFRRNAWRRALWPVFAIFASVVDTHLLYADGEITRCVQGHAQAEYACHGTHCAQ